MPINTLDDLRAQYPEFEGQSDDALVDAYSKEKSLDPSFVRNYLGVRAPEPAVDPDMGDFQRAARTYGNQIVGLSAGAAALAHDAIGSDEARDRLFQVYQERTQRMAELSKPAYELEHLTSGDATAGDFVDAAQYYATMGAANLAGGGLSGFVGKQLAKQGLKRITKEATEVGLKRAAVGGFFGGVAASAIAQEVGATYGQAGEERIAEGGSLDDVDTARALAGGLAAGSLEFAGDVFLLGAGRFLPNGAANAALDWTRSGGKLSRTAKGGVATGLAEAATEAGQTVLEDLGADSDIDFGQEDYRKKLYQAAFAGFATGSPIGAASNLVSGDQSKEVGLRSEPEVEQEPPAVEPVTQPTVSGVALRDFIDANRNVAEPLDAEARAAVQAEYDKFGEATYDPYFEDAKEGPTNAEVIGLRDPQPVDEPVGPGPVDIINEATGVDRPAEETEARRKQTKEAVKAAYELPSGVFVVDENQQEVELSMGEFLEWTAVNRYNQNKAPDAPEMSFSRGSQAQPTVIGVDANGNEVRQTLNPDSPQFDEAIQAALQTVDQQVAPAQQEEAQQAEQQTDMTTTTPVVEVAELAARVADGGALAEIKAVLSPREGEVWDLLVEKFGNNEVEDVINAGDSNSKSEFSAKQIAKFITQRGGRMDRGTAGKMLERMRDKIQNELGINVADALAELNRQRRNTEAFDEGSELGPQGFGTEVSQEEISGASATLNVRESSKGQFELGNAPEDTANESEARKQDNARIDDMLAIPQVEEVTQQTYDATPEGQKKPWAELGKTARRNKFRQFEKEAAEEVEQKRIAQENLSAAEESLANHKKAIEVFTREPMWAKSIEMFDAAAEQNPEEELRVNFAGLSAGHKNTFMEMVATAPRNPRAISKAVLEAGAAIFEELANEKGVVRSTGRLSGRGSAPTGIGAETGTGDATVLEDQRETAQRVQGAAQKLAAEGKITTRRKRRIVKTPSGMAHAATEEFVSGMTVQAAQRAVDRIVSTNRWKEMGWSIQVVASNTELNGILGETLHSKHGVFGIQAVDADGNPIVYVVANMHEDLQDIEETVLHEVAGHVGMSMFWGGNNKKLFRDLAIFASMGEEQILEMADRFGVKQEILEYQQSYRDQGMEYVETTGMMLEEMIAFAVGKKKNAGARAALKRYLGEAKQALRRIGAIKTSAISDNEILVLMHRLNRSVQGRAVSEFIIPEQAYQRAGNLFDMQEAGVPLEALDEFMANDMMELADSGIEGLQVEDLISILDNAVRSGRFRVTDTGDVVSTGQRSGEPFAMARRRTEAQAARRIRARSQLGSIADRIGSAVKAGTAASWADEVRLAWKTLEQIAYETDFTEVRSYVDAVHKIQRAAKNIIAEAHTVNKHWSQMQSEHPDATEAMGDLMVNATLASFDPDTDTVSDPEHTELKNAWDALPEPVKQLYRDVRDHYVEMRRRKIDALEFAVLQAEAELKNPDGTSVKLEKLRGDIESMKAARGPYFPLQRLGKYYAVGMSQELQALDAKHQQSPLSGAELTRYRNLRKDPEHYRVESFGWLDEANKRADEMEEEFGYSYSNLRSEQFQREAANVPDIDKIQSYFAQSDLFDDASQSKVRAVLSHMYADLLPSNSAMKSTMKREGVAGVRGSDMRQIFAHAAVSDAHQISRLQHSRQLNNALFDVKNMGEDGDQSARRVANEIALRAGKVYDNEGSAIADTLMTLGYGSNLLLSPAYMMINVSQTPMIAAPYLAARHSVRAVGRELWGALSDTHEIVKANWAEDGWRLEFNWDNSKLPDDERQMLQELLERDKLDITLEHDLSAVAKSGTGAGAFSRSSDMMQFLNTPVRVIEIYNRAGTALAAYRLEKARIGDKGKAAEYAIQTVNDTQLDYSALNAPRAMQSVMGSQSLARVMFQFRKFQQGMVNLVMVNMKRAIAEKDPQTRREAQRLMVGLFTTTGIMSGMTGVPLAGTIAWAINMMMGDEDEPYDVMIEMRNGLTSMLGETAAIAVMKGLPAIAPGGGVDLTKRVGLGDILFPLPFARFGDNNRENAGELVLASLGAAPSTLVNMADGTQELFRGNYYKGLEKVVPVKAVRDVVKAMRLADEGLTDSRDEPIFDPDEYDAFAVLYRALGFGSARDSIYYENRNRVYELKRGVENQRSELLRKFSQAALSGDRRELRELRRDIVTYNRKYRHPSQRITNKTLRSAVDRRRENRRNLRSSGLRGGDRYQPYNDLVEPREG